MMRIFGREMPRNLVIARLFYLFFFSSFGSLFPLLAVYFKQLGGRSICPGRFMRVSGMSAAQAGVLLGCRPLVEFASAPFWGSFGDRFRKGKVLLMFSLASFIFFTLAIGFVQVSLLVRQLLQ